MHLLLLVPLVFASLLNGGELTWTRLPPTDVTQPAGTTAVFLATPDQVVLGLNPTTGTVWHRIRGGVDVPLADGGGITGANGFTLNYPITAADDGARFYVVMRCVDKSNTIYGPNTSPQATLRVLPAGTDLPPLILSPPATTIIPRAQSQTVTAQGVGLKWRMTIAPYSPTPSLEWGTPSRFDGAQQARFAVPVIGSGTTDSQMQTVTIEITDASNRTASRTWTIEPYENTFPPQLPSNPIYFSDLSKRGIAIAPGSTTFPKERGLLSGVTSPNPPVTAQLISGPASGTGIGVVVNTDGSFTITFPLPPTAINLAAPYQTQFTYRVIDSRGNASGTGTAVVFARPNRGDINRDGVVNIDDLQAVISEFGTSW